MDEFITKTLTAIAIVLLLLLASRAEAQQPQPAVSYVEQALSARLLREINESLQKDQTIMALQAQLRDLQDKVEKAKTEQKPE